MPISPREQFLSAVNHHLPAIQFEPTLNDLFDKIIYIVDLSTPGFALITYYGADADGESGEGYLSNKRLHAEMSYYGVIDTTRFDRQYHHRVRAVNEVREFGSIQSLFKVIVPTPSNWSRQPMDYFKDYIKKE